MIPKGWREVRLGDIAKLSSGGTPSRRVPEYWNGSIPWIKTAEIRDGFIDQGDIGEKITEKGLRSSSAKIVRQRAILMAMYGQGETRGRVSVLRTNAAVNQACCVIEVDEGIDESYVYQYLRSMYKYIRSLSNDGSQKNLNMGLIKQLRIVVPPMGEQKSIADILHVWDTAIEKSGALIVAKDKQFQWLRSSTIKAARCEKSVKFGDLLSESKIPDMENDARKRLSVRLHLKGVSIREFRGTESDGPMQYYRRKAGQLIYGKQNIFRGAIGIVPKELDGYSSSQDIPAFDIAKTVNPKWLFWYLSRPCFYKKLENSAAGTGSKRLHPRDLYKIPLALPSLSEQKHIADILDMYWYEIILLGRLMNHYRQQKLGLMQKLLTGKWRLNP